MKYTCHDCQYQGNKTVKGACPACGSQNITSNTPKQQDEAAVKKSKKSKTVLMYVVWAWFLIEVWKKFSVS